jgi:hypothetical protein
MPWGSVGQAGTCKSHWEKGLRINSLFLPLASSISSLVYSLKEKQKEIKVAFKGLHFKSLASLLNQLNLS